MTTFNKTVTGALRFIGGSQLYPDPLLFPGDNEFPFGGAVLVTVNHSINGGFTPHGALATIGAQARLFTAALAPSVSFQRSTTRGLSASLGFAGAASGVRTVHALTKLLTGSLRAAGSFSAMNTNLINPPGGGGFGVPMPDDHFQRYKPTLRRQKMRV